MIEIGGGKYDDLGKSVLYYYKGKNKDRTILYDNNRKAIMKNAILCNPTLLSSSRPIRELNGEWEFRMDPKDEGKRKEWFKSGIRFRDSIKVPGCWQAQGIGEEARELKYQYKGKGWYRKSFSLPGEWKGKVIWLVCGGVAPAADLWINDYYLGFTNSSRSALKWDISGQVKYGEDNLLTIAVSRPELRLDGVWDWLAGGWSGIYRGMKIEATSEVWIDDLFCLPDLDRDGVEMRIGIQNSQKKDTQIEAEIISAQGRSVGFTKKAPQDRIFIPLKEIRLWSPKTPYLYQVVITLKHKQTMLDQVRTRFGMRKIEIKGERILLNGEIMFLRGYGDDQIYPETICPPPDKDFYRRRIKTARDYGFNYVKSCVDVFTPEFLEAADELGLLVTEEMPFGVSGLHRQLRNDPPDKFKKLFRKELTNIVRQDRNHPSVINYSMASELYILEQSEVSFKFFNQELPALARRLNPPALITDITCGTGPSIKTKFGRRKTDICEIFVSASTRDAYRDWQIDKSERPIILHEYAWWSSYPNPKLASKYKDLPAKPYWITEAETAAKRKGLSHLIPLFVKNSEKLQAICRKEGIEFARKCKSVSGYILWLLTDTVYAVEGLLDDFGCPKNVSAEEFRQVNDEAVLLLDDGYRCSYWADEKVKLNILLSNFSQQTINAARLSWKFYDGRDSILEGKISLKEKIGKGDVKSILPLDVSFPAIRKPKKIILAAQLTNLNGKPINSNRWPLWIFPRKFFYDEKGLILCNNIHLDNTALGDIYNTYAYPLSDYITKGKEEFKSHPDLVITDSPTSAMVKYLYAGGKILLLSNGFFPEVRLPYCNLFRTIPWNVGSSGNSGTIISDHPALGDFPHDGYCDFQFIEMIRGVYPLDMEALGRDRPEPIIRSIDHYLKARDKAYMFEVKAGRGRMLVTSLNIKGTYDNNHPATKYLVDQLIRYMFGKKFNPSKSISIRKMNEISRKENIKCLSNK